MPPRPSPNAPAAPARSNRQPPPKAVIVTMHDKSVIDREQGGLTAKQERFVQEYLIDLNATAAYKRAYSP